MNEHVFSYCKDFITSKKNPQFAVFIKGKWGCGKTFFINELIKSLDDEIIQDRLIRISLYGVCSIDEIDRKIYEALHPVLSSKGAKIAGTIFKTALKLGPSFSFGGDDKSISFGLTEFSLSKASIDKITKDNKVIIVDDFERALIPSESILGYFSSIISDTNNRVIFVGNEEKVDDKESFSRIKEKTIGMEFSIAPDFESALDCFLAEVLNDVSWIPIVKKALEEINCVIKCDNLRIVRQAIYNFQLFVSCLPSNLDDSSSVLVKTFFVLFIQRSLGIIKEEEIKDAISAFFFMKMQFDDYIIEKEKHKDDSFWGFPFWSDYESVLSVDLWKSVIFDGSYIREDIESEYRKYLDRKSQEKPNLLFQLFHWINLSQKEFESLYNKVHKGFIDGCFLEPGEIIHYLQLMDRMIDRKLIPMTKTELEEEVNSILDSGKVHALSLEQWQGMISIKVYKNYGFSDFKSSWYNHLIEKLKEACISKSITEMKKEFVKKLSSNANIIELCQSLENKTGSEQYCNVPLLGYLGDTELSHFAIGLSCLKYDDFGEAVSCLKSRYGFGTIDLVKRTLLDEYDSFCKLIELINISLAKEEVLFNPHFHVLSYFKDELDKVKTYLEEKIKLSNSPDANMQRDYV